MSAWTQDDYVKSEFSLGGITLDDILNDYYKDYSHEAPAEEAAPLGASLSSFTGEQTGDLTDIASYLNSLTESVSDAAEYVPSGESYSYDGGSYTPSYEPQYTPEDAAPAETHSRVSDMEAEAKGIFAKLNEDDYARLIAEEEAAAERDASVEIDPRFNLGGRHRRRSMYYNGSEVDLSADPEYSQNDQGFAIPSHYAGEGEPEDDYFVEEKNRKHGLFGRKKRASAPKLEDREPDDGIADEDRRYTRRASAARTRDYAPEEYPPEAYSAEDDTYAPDHDGAYGNAPRYDDAEAGPDGDNAAAARSEDGDSAYVDSFRDYREDDRYASDLDYDEDREEDDRDFPSSFKEFLSGELSGLLLRLRGSAKPGKAPAIATAEDDEEDLGAEVSAKSASKYYGSFIHSLRLRCRIAAVLLFIMVWMSVGLPVSGMLKDIRVASVMLLACQLNIMLLALDVLTGAVMNMSRLRFGADALVLISCIVTSLDAVLVAEAPAVSRHIPLCVLSSLSLLGLLASSLLSARGMRKAIRVPAIAKRIYTVTGETDVNEGDVTLLKSVRSYKGFVRRCEEAPPDETLFIKISPFVVLISLLFALIIALVKDHSVDIVYIFSAVFAPAVPFAALLSFALPYFIGSDRIFDSGAAIAGWSGLCDVGTSQNLIVTDRDLFPEGSVELENIRIFADESSEKVISYAGTMLTAAGSSVSSCFADIMERKGYTMRQVEDFEYLSGGGMKGMIDGNTVLCGSTDLMRLMNVRIPYRLVDKCSVLLAINGVLYGIFNMKYTAQPQVRYALTSLMRSNRHPIFAIRDFNVTPDMLHNTFDVATDGYDFPPYVERFAISDATPSEDSKVAAVVCREGLAPLTHMADTGRSMYIAVRINLIATAIGVALTLLTVFLKLLITGSAGTVFLLVLMVICALPVIAVSVFMRS